MRAFKRFDKRAFTLVELMIVVAIIGVLAALAIYGVRKYLASAKTSEAKNTIGAISRAAAAAFERESSASQVLAEGSASALATNDLCLAASAVPSGFIPKGNKYQPYTTEGSDFEAGTAVTGWKCLRFSLTQPIYYQYTYTRATQIGGLGLAGTYFETAGVGDIDSDGITSTFARGGQVNTSSGTLILSTQVYVANEFE